MENETVILAAGCRLTASGGGEWFAEGSRRFRAPINRRHGAVDIAQTVSEYARGPAPSRRNAKSEEVLYVYEGRGVCHIDGQPYDINPGHAAYIPPGAVYQIENLHGAPLKIISVCCPEETAEIVTGAVERKIAPNPLVVHESARAAIPTGERRFHLLAHKDLGCQRVTQFLGVIPPGQAPQHYHTYEEAIFILNGYGLLWADEASCEFTAGDSIYLAPGQRHCLENIGLQDVRLLGVFYPSGSPATNY